MPAVHLGLEVTVVSALMAAAVFYREGRDFGLMLESQGTKAKLIAASIVSKRLKLLPPGSSSPWVIPGPVLAAADQWSEKGNTSQCDGHAWLKSTKYIGQRHAIGDVCEVQLLEAD